MKYEAERPDVELQVVAFEDYREVVRGSRDVRGRDGGELLSGREKGEGRRGEAEGRAHAVRHHEENRDPSTADGVRMTEVILGGVRGRLKTGSGTQRPRSAEYVIWGECGSTRRRGSRESGQSLEAEILHFVQDDRWGDRAHAVRHYEKIMIAGRSGICLGEK